MSRVSAPRRQTGRIALPSSRRTFRRIFAISLGLGVMLAGAVPTATATEPDPDHKDYVCKYIGQPGVDERLQTGNNPIWVDTAATSAGFFPDLFNDGQRSYVIVADSPKLSPEPGLDACRPPQPDTIVTTSMVSDTTCVAFTTTTTTTTTPFVLRDDVWVPGTSVVTTATVTITPTAAQIAAAELVCASGQPDAQQVVTTENATTCTEYKVRDITVTTPYVLNAENDWVLGTVSTTVVGAWVTSTPTAAQLAAAKLSSTCNPPVVDEATTVESVDSLVVTPAAPIVVKPSKAQIAAANPLPSAARAGDADTGGQLAAGGLAGIGALLLMGAGFVLRRREGEI